MVHGNDFRLLTLGRLALLTPAGEEDDSLGKQRRRLALLAVLALARRPLPREVLAEMFWGDQDEAKARHSLDNSLSHFRRVLGSEVLARRQTEIALAEEVPLDVDAVELADAVAAREYGRAATLYGGSFLDGVHIEGSDRFERWVDGERRRLESLFLEACQKECMALARARRWDECAALAARWLETAPLSTDAALYRLNALKAPGTRDAYQAAFAEYERIRRLLEREYELAPDKAVAALAGEIATRLEQSAPGAAAADPTGAPISGRAATPPAPAPPASAPERLAASSASAAGSKSWRTRRAAFVAVLALAVGALVAVAVATRRAEDEPAGSLMATGVLTPRERILVADFENRTADSSLGIVVTHMLRVDLSQSRAIRVVPPSAVGEVLGRMKRPAAAPVDATVAREVAVREGIKAVIAGEVAAVGSRYVLSAQLLASETGEVLAAGRETADDSTRVIRAVDRLSQQLRERIGESLRSIRATPPLERVTTPSLEALRKYSLASRAYYVEGDGEKAAALYEGAIALDSTFAAAHQGLGAMWINRSDRRARAIGALTKAFQYRQQLTERERYLAEAAYYLRVTSEYEKAAAAYRALLDVIPDDQTALNNLGIAYSEMSDYARAEQSYRRAIELDSSDSFVRYTNVYHYQVIFGRLAEAETTLARAKAKFPGNSLVEAVGIGLVAARGDYAGAEALLRKVRGPNLVAIDRTALASLAVLRGKLADAERYLDDGVAVHAEGGAPQAAVEVATLAGYLDVWFRRAPERGVRRVEAALAKYPLVKMHPLDRPYLPLASFFALAGQPTRARALVTEFEAIDPALRRRQEPGRHAALGVIALAEGRPADAVAELRLADRGQCPVCVVPDLGRAHDAAGERDSAVATYERYARHRMTSLIFFADYFRYEASRAGIYERMGELYEERGDRARAAEYYTRFLDLWKDADAELQPLVADVERRLARLREDGG
jgi:DNA-binding SARP family transcriptional activator/Flp pilus assembly protein TadD/TolB-like protein